MHDKSPVGPSWQAPRRYPRFPLQTKVELRVQQNILMATTGNVSAGGLLVECDPVLPRGTEVHLRFTLPNGFYVETDARVAPEPARRCVHGLERFDEIAARDEARLVDLRAGTALGVQVLNGLEGQE